MNEVESPASHSSPDARPKILFVDDERRILTSLKVIFRGDYDVHTANSGQEAVTLMDAVDFDVIVSDQRMPGMTGVDVLREARQRRPRAVRLLLTGYSDLSAIIGSINEGEIFRFVSKPWSNPDLRATIAAAVEASHIERPDIDDLVLEVAQRAGAPAGANAAGVRSEGGATASSNAASSMPLDDEDAPGILIVDPDMAACTLLRNALGDGRAVHHATSLEQGLDILEKHRIGVVVSELVIHGEVVTGMLSALREHHPSLVTIVMTDQADAQHSIDLINQGQIYRLLQKPVSDGVLRGTMNVASRRFQAMERNPDRARRYKAAPAPAADERRVGLFARIKRLLRPSGTSKVA